MTTSYKYPADIKEVGPLTEEEMKACFKEKPKMYIKDLCFLAAGYDPNQDWVKEYKIEEDIGFPERFFVGFYSDRYSNQLLDVVANSRVVRNDFMLWLEKTLDVWKKDYPSTVRLVNAWRDYKRFESKVNDVPENTKPERILGLMKMIMEKRGAKTFTEAAHIARDDPEFEKYRATITGDRNSKGQKKGDLMSVETIVSNCSRAQPKK